MVVPYGMVGGMVPAPYLTVGEVVKLFCGQKAHVSSVQRLHSSRSGCLEVWLPPSLMVVFL